MGITPRVGIWRMCYAYPSYELNMGHAPGLRPCIYAS